MNSNTIQSRQTSFTILKGKENHTDRQRILTALEYFDAKGWIELPYRQAIEVYDILTQLFVVFIRLSSRN